MKDTKAIYIFTKNQIKEKRKMFWNLFLQDYCDTIKMCLFKKNQTIKGLYDEIYNELYKRGWEYSYSSFRDILNNNPNYSIKERKKFLPFVKKYLDPAKIESEWVQKREDRQNNMLDITNELQAAGEDITEFKPCIIRSLVVAKDNLPRSMRTYYKSKNKISTWYDN